jgi:hypothetical protein
LKRLLIIPARSGSKRIKNKNIKFFFNKRIIFYSIEAALKSKLFKKIHISTESNKYKQIIEKKLKIEFLRPRYLSTNKTPLMKVFKYVVNNYKKKNYYFDEIWFLGACSPLVNHNDLVKMSKEMKYLKKQNSLMTIGEYQAPIQWAHKLLKCKTIIPLNKKFLKIRSQDLKKYYYDTGTVVIFKSEIFYQSKVPKYRGYILTKTKSLDIDDLGDWNLMKKLFKKI